MRIVSSPDLGGWDSLVLSDGTRVQQPPVTARTERGRSRRARRADHPRFDLAPETDGGPYETEIDDISGAPSRSREARHFARPRDRPGSGQCCPVRTLPRQPWVSSLLSSGPSFRDEQSKRLASSIPSGGCDAMRTRGLGSSLPDDPGAYPDCGKWPSVIRSHDSG